METFLVAISQLIFVTVVYALAYKTGYRAAHDKAVTTIRKSSGHVNDLLDRMNETMY